MNYHRIRFFIGICLILITCQIHAATVIKVAVEITNKDKIRNNTNIITYDADKVRVDYLGDGKTRDKTTPYLLTLDAGKNWMLGNQDKDEFYCAKVTMEEFFHDLGNIVAKVDSFVNATYSDDKVELISKQPGPEMHGYKTTHVKIQTTASAKASIFFKKFDYSIKKVDDVWFVEDQIFHIAKQRWVQALTNSGYGELDKLTSRYSELVNGSALRHESVLDVINNRKNKTDIYRRKMKVISIKHVEPSQLPSDIFTKVGCSDMNKKQFINAAKTMFKENKLTL